MKCKCNRKTVMILLGCIGGAAMVGVGAAMIWNSRQLRRMRTFKRAGKIFNKVGAAMQAVSGVVGCD